LRRLLLTVLVSVVLPASLRSLVVQDSLDDAERFIREADPRIYLNRLCLDSLPFGKENRCRGVATWIVRAPVSRAMVHALKTLEAAGFTIVDRDSTADVMTVRTSSHYPRTWCAVHDEPLPTATMTLKLQQAGLQSNAELVVNGRGISAMGDAAPGAAAALCTIGTFMHQLDSSLASP